ncbi:SDR family oxidoreductase [Microvirga puerhi]|uniref:SDR family oxidoreductase n=1 Tax=Microvirga puerhi TaxID=2876078 RepID=A0ABS7VP72_9HYPH|nr:SDR family NAD(P)-dependent oxidoreductase [Microvirga puerhi]MBZ6076748.1 SDR family oxidoreductase [Microvirga puerhi]
MELAGKVALITGAGSGLGKAAALRLAKEGAAIGALSRTESEVKRTVEEIDRNGGKALALVADISDEAAMQRAVDTLVSTYGRLDIVFANAGINGVWAPIDDLTPAEWDRTVNINLRGTYLTLHYTIPHLKKAGEGAILITSSINGTRTFTSAGATAYSATKAAQLAMAQMLALELAKHRIRVNAICPGKIETNIPDNTTFRNTEEAMVPAAYPAGDIPLTGGAAGTSDEVAELVLFLVSNRSRHITGTPVWIDGGQSLLI